MLLFVQSCAQQSPESPDAHSPESPDAYSDGFFLCGEGMAVYATPNENVAVLDYETMEHIPLCRRPNCKHNDPNCLIQRLNGRVPVFEADKAYYFVNDPSQFVETDNGGYDLKLGSTLYVYDMAANIETKLCHIEGGEVDSLHGLLLHDGNLFFILNEYSREYDENGLLIGGSNCGGNNRLCAVNLSDAAVTDYGRLYDVEKLTEYYPGAPYSAESTLCGIFENKLWFNVSCVETAEWEDNVLPDYLHYVTIFDLDTETYEGEPKDYVNIAHGRVRFVSEDYLAIASGQQVSVYRAGEEEPVVFTHDSFNEWQVMSVFDDTLFCAYGNAFDLHTKVCTPLPERADSTVIAVLDDSYIVSDMNVEGKLEKVSKADYYS